MTRVYKRHSKEMLEEVVQQSNSFSEVCRTLGKSPVGGSITHIKLMCDRWGIDYSHMTGQAHMKNKRSPKRKTTSEFLVVGVSTDHRIAASRIKPHMLEAGIEYKCNKCGIQEWLGEPLTLEIDHIDECYWNNTLDNLQFLCPNCHAQKTKGL